MTGNKGAAGGPHLCAQPSTVLRGQKVGVLGWLAEGGKGCGGHSGLQTGAMVGSGPAPSTVHPQPSPGGTQPRAGWDQLRVWLAGACSPPQDLFFFPQTLNRASSPLLWVVGEGGGPFLWSRFLGTRKQRPHWCPAPSLCVSGSHTPHPRLLKPPHPLLWLDRGLESAPCS